MTTKTHLLFSYGTLQLEKVQKETYGRILKGKKDRLIGYRIKQLKITNTDVLSKSGIDRHPIAIKSGNDNDVVDGMLFELTENELTETDKYEVSQYHRILETFESGKNAWVYVGEKV